MRQKLGANCFSFMTVHRTEICGSGENAVFGGFRPACRGSGNRLPPLQFPSAQHLGPAQTLIEIGRPMSSPGERFLLPAGLSDGLPPEAGFEAAIVERLMAAFAAWGYERFKPPLIEFEDSLLSGPGEAMAADTFRLMDPVSQRMMGLRADITPQ